MTLIDNEISKNTFIPPVVVLYCCSDWGVCVSPEQQFGNDSGKKVIYVERLGLPEYLNVSELLQLFPECVARGDELYSNFDIQYDGKSVGSGRDIFLFQTKLSQIEKIEISTSSVATQQNSF